MIRARISAALRTIADLIDDEPALENEPTRPKVGAWVHLNTTTAYIYDDRGQCVGGVVPIFQSTRFSWHACWPCRPAVFGEADTKEAAQSKAVAVLATWADVSQIQGQGAVE